VYAMLPKIKTKKCEEYKADSTPFRKHERKAYVRDYMHGFSNMFAPEARPTGLECMSFIEIMEIDWVPFSSDTKTSFQDVPATPSKKVGRSDITSAKGKRRIAFDPFADLGTGSRLTLEERLLKAKSDSQSQTTGRE
jgi:hypothetical protein